MSSKVTTAEEEALEVLPASASSHDTILKVLGEASSVEGLVEDSDDVFSRFNLTSLQIFAAIVRLEKVLDIVIGETPSEFDRIRTFGGLKQLIDEKRSFCNLLKTGAF